MYISTGRFNYFIHLNLSQFSIFYCELIMKYISFARCPQPNSQPNNLCGQKMFQQFELL